MSAQKRSSTDPHVLCRNCDYHFVAPDLLELESFSLASYTLRLKMGEMHHATCQHMLITKIVCHSQPKKQPSRDRTTPSLLNTSARRKVKHLGRICPFSDIDPSKSIRNVSSLWHRTFSTCECHRSHQILILGTLRRPCPPRALSLIPITFSTQESRWHFHMGILRLTRN